MQDGRGWKEPELSAPKRTIAISFSAPFGGRWIEETGSEAPENVQELAQTG